jgi:uncharacterized protein YacL (UPF0231 family)
MSDLPDELKKTQVLAQKTMKRMQDTIVENAKQQEELFFNGIIKASQEVRTKLPEEVFVKNFLPFFSGKQSIKENPDVIPNWIGIAGSPTSPVDVIDNSGNVIYTVPGFYDTTIIKANSRFENSTLSETMTQYEMDKSVIPQRANHRIQKELEKKLPTMFQESTIQSENKKAWDTIFQKYGIKTNQDTVQKNNEQTAVRNDLEYD